MEVVSTACFPLEPAWSYGLSAGLPLCFEPKMEVVLEVETEQGCPAARALPAEL